MNRRPNQGPYIVSWIEWADKYVNESNKVQEKEFQLWSDACAHMRECIIQHKQNVSVRFA